MSGSNAKYHRGPDTPPLLLLPPNVEQDIVARLPLEDLLALRATCKGLVLTCRKQVDTWRQAKLLLRDWQALCRLTRILTKVREMVLGNLWEEWMLPNRTLYETLKPKFLELVTLGKSGSAIVDQEALLTALRNDRFLQFALLGILFRVYQAVKASRAEKGSCLRKALRPLKIPMRMFETIVGHFRVFLDIHWSGECATLLRKVQPHVWRRCLAKLPSAALRVIVAAANSIALQGHIFEGESVNEIPWFWIGP